MYFQVGWSAFPPGGRVHARAAPVREKGGKAVSTVEDPPEEPPERKLCGGTKLDRTKWGLALISAASAFAKLAAVVLEHHHHW